MFRLFPVRNVLGDDAEDCDLFSGDFPHVVRLGQRLSLIGDVGGDAWHLQLVDVVHQDFLAVIEIVVAQIDIVIADGVHDLGEGVFFPFSFFKMIVSQRRTFQDVTVIDEDGVFIL